MRILRMVALFSVCWSAATLAQSFSSEAAHEHGVAALDVAQEGQTLDVYLQSPLANLLGFEHAPKDARQRQLVQDLAQWLQSGSWLQLPAQAGCQVVQTDVQGLTGQHETAQHQHDHKDKNKHDHQHQHDHNHKHEEQHSHADLQLTQRFHCQQPQALKQIEVALFAKAVDLQRLNVQWVNAAGQGAATLTKANTVLAWQAQ